MKRFFALVLSIVAVLSAMLLGTGCSGDHTGNANWTIIDDNCHGLVCECGEELPVNKAYSDTNMLIMMSTLIGTGSSAYSYLPVGTTTVNKYVAEINAQLGTDFANFDEYLAEYGEYKAPHYYTNINGTMTCICGHTK